MVTISATRSTAHREEDRSAMQPIVHVSFYDEVTQQTFETYDSAEEVRERAHEERAIVEVGIAGGQLVEVVVLPDGQYEVAVYDSAQPRRQSSQHLAAGDLEGPPQPG